MKINEDIECRKLVEDDLNNVFNLTSKDRISEFMYFKKHKSIDEAKELLDKYIKNEGYAILIRNEFAGVFVFKEYENENEYSMSTFLNETYWNKGYSTVILSYMMKYAKEELKAKALVAYVVERNEGSRKVLLNNDFNESKVLHFEDLPCGLIIYRKEL